MESLEPIQLSVALIAVAAGAVVQGSIGFGFVLSSAWVIGLIRPDALPAVFLILAVPLAAWMAYREHSDIDIRGFWQITFGRIFGTAAAAWVLAVVAEDMLAVLVGIAIVIAVLISAFASGIEAGNRGRLVAGVVSGLMGTVGAVGGPASALAYQHRSGPEIRSTLAATFVIGTLMSLGALAIAGRLEAWHWRLSLLLLPGMIVGLALSTRVIKSLDARWLRPAVLICAGVGGITIALKGL